VHDNGVCGAGKQEGKPLSFKAAEMIKPGDKDSDDAGENRLTSHMRGGRGSVFFFTVTRR
jgi:hypothetical protein